jgi:phytoene dehydrogenase-like protein
VVASDQRDREEERDADDERALGRPDHASREAVGRAEPGCVEAAPEQAAQHRHREHGAERECSGSEELGSERTDPGERVLEDPARERLREDAHGDAGTGQGGDREHLAHHPDPNAPEERDPHHDERRDIDRTHWRRIIRDRIASVLDAIVVGGGHNGLTAAAYLARAGRRVLVLERRSILGGACVTEELWPGYRISRAAYVAGLLRPLMIRELDLERHGLRLIPRRPASSFTPLPDGRGLLLGEDRRASEASIAQFSRADAAAFPRYEAVLDRAARALEPLLDVPPPDPAQLHVRDLVPLARAGLRVLGLRRDAAALVRLLLAPARSTLEGWFESEPLRATLATDAVIGAWASPASPGTGYVLLHHVMGETLGARGVWAYVAGGMGGLSEALAAAAREAGAELRTGAPVARITTYAGRACGVLLEDGTEVEARRVVSCADPARTFLDLLDAKALDPAFRREIEGLDFRSPVMKINLALDRLPRFGPSVARDASVAAGPEHTGTIHVGANDLDALDASFAAAAAGRVPERPMVELTLPSALDPTLAPEGHHVASLFVQHAPLAPDAGWNATRDQLAERAVAMVEEVAPGFASSIVHRDVLAAPDLERVFGLTGGNIFHGAMSLDRLAFLRPAPGWARYRTPISDLWLCGAGTHPGGGVMGACGRNAARELLRDLRRERREG